MKNIKTKVKKLHKTPQKVNTPLSPTLPKMKKSKGPRKPKKMRTPIQ